MKKFFKVLFSVLTVLYPVLVFTLLVVFKLPVRVLSLCAIVLAVALLLSVAAARSNRKEKDKNFAFAVIRPIILSVLLLVAALFCYFTNQSIFIKLYAVAVSLVMLILFGITLIFPPNIIYTIATLMDKSIKGSISQPYVEAYCKKVTIAWCIFFLVNGSISVYTAFCSNDLVWSVYNGGISYALLGLMFLIEFNIRMKVNKNMPSVHTITTFTADSRPDNYMVCYEGIRSRGVVKTWYDFLTDCAKVRMCIEAHDKKDWILHSEDYWYFLVTFVALLQCKKTIHLTQNIATSFIQEIKTQDVMFITDQPVKDETAIQIKEVLAKYTPVEQQIRMTPAIDAETTDIRMYTSGSTGKPKAVRQRMKEFELDNAFVISKWGQEFLSRYLVTTVSQHHIYGFLFGICLPFALGVPFRRTRITIPEEFELLNDDKYMIIATPAFLKRTVDTYGDEPLPLQNCFIFTSGGAVSEELAKKVNAVFGFCPLEVYGSTETSGIAYRQQSVNGLRWTPFDNAKIWKGDDECLRIISPYIKNPEGFATADLVTIFDDGTFLLRGRADSIVKIEEKRISLPEVESRLLDSGLIADVKVIALEDRRQYLAAAIELNEKGKKKFQGERKLVINRYFHDFLSQWFENVLIPKKWRFLDHLPTDVQGKKHKDEIAALFAAEED